MNIRNNGYALLGLSLAFVAAIGGVGCSEWFVKTESLTTPGKRVDAQAIAVEVASTQKDFSVRFATLNAEADKFKLRADAANADLAKKSAQVQSVVSGLGTITETVLSGTVDPTSILKALPTLLIAGWAGGSWRDKKKLETALSNTRQPDPVKPTDPTPVPDPTPAPQPYLKLSA